MGTSARELPRLAVLVGSGLLFPAIAVAGAVAPKLVLEQYGLSQLSGPDAMNQFRAVFFGFWLSLGAFFLTAAWKRGQPLLGDLCGLALVLQAAGRALAFALDGKPSGKFVAAFALELVAGALVLAGRPRRS